MPRDKLMNSDSLFLRVHGDLDDYELRTLGLDPTQVLDFSTNTNTYGPTESVLSAIRNTPINRYPDSTSKSLRIALGNKHNVTPDEIIVGNGAADLLWTIARVYVTSQTKALIVEPTFAEFRAACDSIGAEITEWRATEENGFQIDVNSVANSIKESKAKVIYICVPNSPTGAAIPAEEVKTIAINYPDTIFVLDQCFLTLSEYHADKIVAMPRNVIRVLSLTKDHSIPGIRIGYVIASEDTCTKLEAARPSWTTNAIAQAAALAAIKEDGFVADSRKKMLHTRDYIVKELFQLGFKPIPSKTPFFLLPVNEASKVRKCLLRKGIVVRDCTSFGLRNYFRISARPKHECDLLISALTKELL